MPFVDAGAPVGCVVSVILIGCLTYAKVISYCAFGVGATTQKLASQLA